MGGDRGGREGGEETGEGRGRERGNGKGDAKEEGKGGDTPRVGSHPHVRNPEKYPECNTRTASCSFIRVTRRGTEPPKQNFVAQQVLQLRIWE